jgi:hypothetical protein
VPEIDGVVVLETQYSKSFMMHIMNSIDYAALCHTTKEVSAEMVVMTAKGFIKKADALAVVAAVEPPGGADSAGADPRRPGGTGRAAQTDPPRDFRRTLQPLRLRCCCLSG